MISSMQWFYAEKVDLKEKQVGPVDETALQLLIAEGRFQKFLSSLNSRNQNFNKTAAQLQPSQNTLQALPLEW